MTKTKWKKNPKKYKKHVKVPVVKLCIDCKRPNARKAERCTACQKYYDANCTKRTEKDGEYEDAYRKHMGLA